MSFMMRIEAAQRPPLEQLAVDFFNHQHQQQSEHPSIDLCRRIFGVPDTDEAVAKRLSVAVSKVRGWRELGRRASRWSCG